MYKKNEKNGFEKLKGNIEIEKQKKILQMDSMIYLYFALAGISLCQSNVLVADNTMSRMIEMSASPPFCVLHHDRGVIQRMILNADPKKVRQMSSNLVTDLEETCKASRNSVKVCKQNNI